MYHCVHAPHDLYVIVPIYTFVELLKALLYAKSRILLMLQTYVYVLFERAGLGAL